MHVVLWCCQSSKKITSASVSVLIINVCNYVVPYVRLTTGWSNKNGATLHFPEYLENDQRYLHDFFAYIKASVY